MEEYFFDLLELEEEILDFLDILEDEDIDILESINELNTYDY